jgi:hypothetical protein
MVFEFLAFCCMAAAVLILDNRFRKHLRDHTRGQAFRMRVPPEDDDLPAV